MNTIIKNFKLFKILALFPLVSCSETKEYGELDFVKDSLTEDVAAVEFIEFGQDPESLENGKLNCDKDSLALSIKYIFDKTTGNSIIEYSEYFIRENRYNILRKDVNIYENQDSTEIRQYDENQSLYKRSVYLHDENGKETSHDYFDGDGQLMEHSVTTYSKPSDCYVQNDYDEEGKPLRRMISWQKKRVCTERVIAYDGSNVNEAYQGKYDRSGRLVWINHIDTGGQSYSGTIKRNRKGLPVKTINCEADITGGKRHSRTNMNMTGKGIG